MPSYGRGVKTYTIVDTTITEKVVWDAEFDDDYYCCVSQFSEDLFCLTIEEMQTGQMVTREYFAHKGQITPDVIKKWKNHVELTMDQHYQCEYERR